MGLVGPRKDGPPASDLICAAEPGSADPQGRQPERYLGNIMLLDHRSAATTRATRSPAPDWPSRTTPDAYDRLRAQPRAPETSPCPRSSAWQRPRSPTCGAPRPRTSSLAGKTIKKGDRVVHVVRLGQPAHEEVSPTRTGSSSTASGRASTWLRLRHPPLRAATAWPRCSCASSGRDPQALSETHRGGGASPSA